MICEYVDSTKITIYGNGMQWQNRNHDVSCEGNSADKSFVYVLFKMYLNID